MSGKRPPLEWTVKSRYAVLRERVTALKALQRQMAGAIDVIEMECEHIRLLLEDPPPPKPVPESAPTVPTTLIPLRAATHDNANFDE